MNRFDTDPEFNDAIARIDGWVRRWGSHLLAAARAHSSSEADAQDAVAKCWEVALARWDRLPQEDQVRGWLMGITMNVARSQVRKDQRRHKLVKEYPDEVAPRRNATQRPVEIQLLAEATLREIAGLSDLQREVVVRRIFDGASTEQVARAMDTTEGTIKATLFRALGNLRRVLGADFDEALASISSRGRTST